MPYRVTLAVLGAPAHKDFFGTATCRKQLFPVQLAKRRKPDVSQATGDGRKLGVSGTALSGRRYRLHPLSRESESTSLDRDTLAEPDRVKPRGRVIGPTFRRLAVIHEFRHPVDGASSDSGTDTVRPRTPSTESPGRMILPRRLAGQADAPALEGGRQNINYSGPTQHLTGRAPSSDGSRTRSLPPRTRRPHSPSATDSPPFAIA